MVAASSLVLCRAHVFQWHGAHGIHNSRSHRGVGDLSAARSGLLFFAVFVRRGDLVDGEPATHRREGIPDQRQQTGVSWFLLPPGLAFFAATGMRRHDAQPAIIAGREFHAVWKATKSLLFPVQEKD
jgi:hypothetical protein